MCGDWGSVKGAVGRGSSANTALFGVANGLREIREKNENQPDKIAFMTSFRLTHCRIKFTVGARMTPMSMHLDRIKRHSTLQRSASLRIDSTIFQRVPVREPHA